METQTSEAKTNCCNLDQSTCDAGNAMVAMVLAFTGLIYLSTGDWTGALMWLFLAASCALAIGVPNIWKESWKTPRSLASIACCAMAIALLALTPPHHNKSHAAVSAEPAATASGAK